MEKILCEDCIHSYKIRRRPRDFAESMEYDLSRSSPPGYIEETYCDVLKGEAIVVAGRIDRRRILKCAQSPDRGRVRTLY